MPSDFGDESGEKLVDWLIDIGQNASDSLMHSSAEKLKSAFHKACAGSTVLGEACEGESLDMGDNAPKWAKLSMSDFEKLPEYESLREIIDQSLDKAAIEHDFFRDEQQQREWLLFKVEDASEVSEVFHDLEQKTDKALDESLRRRGKTREQIRDEESLEVRAKAAREASKAAEATRDKDRVIERFEMRSK